MLLCEGWQRSVLAGLHCHVSERNLDRLAVAPAVAVVMAREGGRRNVHAEGVGAVAGDVPVAAVSRQSGRRSRSCAARPGGRPHPAGERGRAAGGRLRRWRGPSVGAGLSSAAPAAPSRESLGSAPLRRSLRGDGALWQSALRRPWSSCSRSATRSSDHATRPTSPYAAGADQTRSIRSEAAGAGTVGVSMGAHAAASRCCASRSAAKSPAGSRHTLWTWFAPFCVLSSSTRNRSPTSR